MVPSHAADEDPYPSPGVLDLQSHGQKAAGLTRLGWRETVLPTRSPRRSPQDRIRYRPAPCLRGRASSVRNRKSTPVPTNPCPHVTKSSWSISLSRSGVGRPCWRLYGPRDSAGQGLLTRARGGARPASRNRKSGKSQGRHQIPSVKTGHNAYRYSIVTMFE